MIEDFSKLVLFLGPFCLLISFLMILFSILSPTLILHNRQWALLTVTSTNITPAAPDHGPDLFLGALGLLIVINFSRPVRSVDLQVLALSTQATPIRWYASTLHCFPLIVCYIFSYFHILTFLKDTSAIQFGQNSTGAYTILSNTPGAAPTAIVVSIILSLFFLLGYLIQAWCLKSTVLHNQCVAGCGVLGFLMGMSGPGTQLSAIQIHIISTVHFCFEGLIPFIVMCMWFQQMLTDYNTVALVEEARGTHCRGWKWLYMWVLCNLSSC